MSAGARDEDVTRPSSVEARPDPTDRSEPTDCSESSDGSEPTDCSPSTDGISADCSETGAGSGLPDACATVPAFDGEPRWLDEDETQAWQAVTRLFLTLPGVLDAQLQRDSGLSLFEYLVLSYLSMSPERTLRMSELAGLANGSLSRLSNVAKRLEHRGWIRREPDPEDGRYTVAVLTAAGWDVVVKAAPGHVEAVRRFVIDPLNGGQIRSLRAIGARIMTQVDAAGNANC